MKLLPPSQISKGFEYVTLKRSGMVALVKVVRPKVQATLNYEVWRIQSHNGYVLAGRKIEAGESIPSTSTWGRQGWSYCADDYEGAKKKYLSLIEK